MIRVTYQPMELQGADIKEFPDATRYIIHEDNTLELRYEYDTEDGKRKYRAVAHVHADRWRDVEIVEDAEVE